MAGEESGVVDLAQAGLEDREFIAAETGGGIAFLDRRGDALGSLVI